MYGPPREHDSYMPEQKHWRNTAELEPKLDERAAENLAELRKAMGLPAKEASYDSWVGDYYAMRAREAGYADLGTYKFWLGQIRTAFEQTDAIYDERLMRDEEEEYPFGAWAVRGVGTRRWDLPPQHQPDPTQLSTAPQAENPFLQEDSSDMDEIDMDILQATQSRMMSQFSASQSRRTNGGGEEEEEGLEDLSDGEIDERAIAAAQAEEDDDERQVRREERDELFPKGDEEDDYWQMDDELYDSAEANPDSETGQARTRPQDDGGADQAADEGPAQQHPTSAIPQKRAATDDQPKSDLDPNDRPIKQPKTGSRASLRPQSGPPPARSTPSPSPGVSPRKRNPFASPKKKLRVDTPHNPLAATPTLKQYPSLLDDHDPDAEHRAPQSVNRHHSTAASDQGPPGWEKERTAEDVVRALKTQLGDGIMDDNFDLTPTQIDPAAAIAPAPQPTQAAVLPASSPAPTNTKPTATQPPAPTSTKRKVMFDLPDQVVSRSPASSVRSQFGPPPTPTLPSSGTRYKVAGSHCVHETH